MISENIRKIATRFSSNLMQGDGSGLLRGRQEHFRQLWGLVSGGLGAASSRLRTVPADRNERRAREPQSFLPGLVESLSLSLSSEYV